MISNLRISLVELVIWAVLAMAGLAWMLARVFDGLERARDWWIDRRDSRESGVPVSGFRRLREWTRDRVTPLLEDDPCLSGPHEDGCACEECELPPLPPERSWEQMTSDALAAVAIYDAARQDMNVGPLEASLWHDVARERRPPAYESEARAHYVAMGFDYPSGLMARVRELTP